MQISHRGRIIVEFATRNRWILQDPVAYRIVSDDAQVVVEICVPALFMTDGASVPAAFLPFVPRWHRKWSYAALLHDYLYSDRLRTSVLAQRFGMDGRRWADACMYAAIGKSWRRLPIWLALRLFGWWAYWSSQAQ